MIEIRKSEERGHADHGWLNTRFTFSFADYYDPKHEQFRTLRVMNDDRVAGGGGFPTHPHRDMEIVTYVLEGALQHKDSMGNGSVIRPGDVQYMSAGTGVAHSEFNASKTDPVHFLQIWLVPAERGIEPSYEEKTFTLAEKKGRLRLIASPDLWNHYAAAVFRARLPRRLIPLDRGARLQGHSKMNFVSLLTHGLSAISVFSDQVSARLLTASAAFSVLALAAILSSHAIPGWTREMTAWLIGLMLQSLTFAILFAFLIASRRSSAGFILQRDAPYFILGKTPVRSKAPARSAR